MIGFLFGAGASYGSQSQDSPPLGKDLFKEIEFIEIGPRCMPFKDFNESIKEGMDYLDPRNWEVQQSITVGQWVQAISQESLIAFQSGNFELGLSLLEEELEQRKKSNYFMMGLPYDDRQDKALPERIMNKAAVILSKFRPSPENLYRRILSALPNGAWLFTLNYDALIEVIAVESFINLIEPSDIKKVHFSHPAKELSFIQLHGGVTLCSSWEHPRRILAGSGTISHSELQRISIRSHCAYNCSFTLEPDEYEIRFSHVSAMAFYNPIKRHVIAPDRFKSYSDQYASALNDSVDQLFVIGCKYLKHDRHVWDPIRAFRGELYWCGDDIDTGEFSSTPLVLGKRFEDSIDSIINIVESKVA